MALGVHIAEYGIHQGEARWLYFAGNKQGPEAETIYLSFEMTTEIEAHGNLVLGINPRENEEIARQKLRPEIKTE